MPRVTTHTKSPRKTKYQYRCARCGGDIEPGQRYFQWAIKSSYGGTVYRQHTDCGYPRPTQLSRSKMAQVEEAVQDAQEALWRWTPELDEDGEYSGGFEDVSSALESLAETAREVGEEYRDGVQNMPEGFQQGDTAQAMEGTADELDSWADDLESFEPSNDTPDLPDRDEDESDEDFLARREEELESWADGVRSDADDLIGNQPYYQG